VEYLKSLCSLRSADPAALVVRSGPPPYIRGVAAHETQSRVAPGVALRTEVVVIGAGQGGLSAAYHLKRRGLSHTRGFVVLDQSPRPGGAWQYRWPSLTLGTVNRIHDLPDLKFSDVIDTAVADVQASVAVPEYFAEYEKRFDLPVFRPVKVKVVCERDDRFRVETERGYLSARGIINATGTWDSPYIPTYPGADTFRGRQMHTRDFHAAEAFAGQHVIVVGGGISAIQLLDQISRVTTTTWVTRSPPDFRDGPFDETRGRAAVAIVEDRVRRGLPPGSVVSVTGIPLTPAIQAMRERGVLERLPMFREITSDGAVWPDGTFVRADVILGYGPSASTIGANRAGGAAAAEIMATLQIV
jgi:cation diffusion facilitator CzcD-associated flavoprotein CzcO